jgi:hypothetical protein
MLLALPLGNGTNSRQFVLSLHKFLFETADDSLFALRGANASIAKTSTMLDRWANQGSAGSSSMPRESRLRTALPRRVSPAADREVAPSNPLTPSKLIYLPAFPGASRVHPP